MVTISGLAILFVYFIVAVVDHDVNVVIDVIYIVPEASVTVLFVEMGVS